LNCAGKIVAIGRNYAAHARELNNTPPKEPFFFLKPTTSYLPSGGKLEIPRGIVAHHEGAFLCDDCCFKLTFLGSGAWTRHRQAGQRHIASKRRVSYRRLQYVIRAPVSPQAHLVRCVRQALAVDMTARNLQEKVKKQGLPWSTVKGFDTFTPIGCVPITCLGHPLTMPSSGRAFIPKSAISDPHGLRLQLKVQKSSSSCIFLLSL